MGKIYCPLDRSVMRQISLYDGYENNRGQNCGACGFLYEYRSNATLREQATQYHQNLKLEYRSLSPTRLRREVARLWRESKEKRGELENKLRVMA